MARVKGTRLERELREDKRSPDTKDRAVKVRSRRPTLTAKQRRELEEKLAAARLNTAEAGTPSRTPRPTTREELAETRARVIAEAALKEARPAVDESIRRAPGAEKTGRAILDVGLGGSLAKLLPGGAPAREASPAWVLADAALLGPGSVLKGAKAAVGAVRGAGKADAAVKMPAKARVPAPPRTRPMPDGATVASRTLQVGEKVQQLPAARSRVTRNLIEKPADAVSRAMMGDGKVAGAARKVLPTAAASARVARASGREQVLEAARTQARLSPHLRALPKEGSPADIAHFWWRQLPKSHRNAEGLKLVRGKQTEELAEITSGRALEALKQQEGALRAQLGTADETTKFDLLKQIEDVRLLISDLPARVEDISRSVARLDQVIAAPPKLDDKIIDAMGALSGDRRQLLEEAKVLNPERAGEREGLVSRFVGLEPTGEEGFVGHRLGKVRSSQPSLTPVSVGAGRVKLPQGVSRENKLVLAKTGRVRESTRVAAEDWQAAQVYRSATTARRDLAQMGAPFTGRLPEGHVLVNPKGRAVPPHWKTDKLAKIGQEGFDEDEVLKASQEIVSTFMADASQLDDMLAAAKAAGVQWDELRVVPEQIARRYFGQFTPAAGSTKAGKVYDAAVDFTAASIIFARLGYIPKNVAQNLILAVPHQGPRLLANAPRAGQILADPQLRPLFQAEVGFSGATQGLVGEARFGQKLRGAPAKAANVVGKIGDDPIRISALVHELANAGVIPKLKPVLDDADRAQLLKVFTDKKFRPLLNDSRSRAVEAMADFSRLTPTQRRWARRFLIIPGWLHAGSRYPVHFAATHPGRSAAIAYAAAGEPGAPEELQVNKPITDYMAKDLPHYIDGFDIGGRIARTTSLSPVSTPWEIANALAQKSADTAAGYANPLATALFNVADRRVSGPDGPYRTSFRESLQRNAERLAPNVDLVRDLVRPDGSGRYPEDASRRGRLKRELGVLPIEVERQKTPAQRATSKVFEEREKLFLEEKRLGLLEDGRLPKETREAFNRKATVEAARIAATAGLEAATPEYHRARLAAELKVLRQWGEIDAAEERDALLWARSADLDDLKAERAHYRHSYFDDLYLAEIRGEREYAEEKGADLG